MRSWKIEKPVSSFGNVEFSSTLVHRRPLPQSLPPLALISTSRRGSQNSVVGGTVVCFNRYTSSFFHRSMHAYWQTSSSGALAVLTISARCKLASIHFCDDGSCVCRAERSGCSGEKSMPIGVSENFGILPVCGWCGKIAKHGNWITRLVVLEFVVDDRRIRKNYPLNWKRKLR